MTEIVGACLSQFHNDENMFELLLAYADGREIGHSVSRAAAQRIADDFAQEFPPALAPDPAGEDYLVKAAKAVEEWWLTRGKFHFDGAPYAIFALREALQSKGGEA
jgi:hypothetical protein